MTGRAAAGGHAAVDEHRGEGVPPALLDDWLPAWTVRSVHRRSGSVDPDVLWAVAHEVRVRDCLLLGRLVRTRVPGVGPGMTFAEMFATAPFCVLAEGRRHGLYGLCGRIWSARREYPVLAGAGEFREWNAPGTVRVLFAHWSAPTRPGPDRASEGAELVSEVRVAAVDARARVRLAAMDPFIRAFNGLIGVEALASAVRRAERLPDGRLPAERLPGERLPDGRLPDGREI